MMMTRRIDLQVEGMSCEHCVMTVKTALLGEPGVKNAKVNLRKKSAQITAVDSVEPSRLVEVINQLGYSASE